jgi:hypothetical protein
LIVNFIFSPLRASIGGILLSVIVFLKANQVIFRSFLVSSSKLKLKHLKIIFRR